MSEKVIIRDARVEDIPAIVELWKEMMEFNRRHDRRWTPAANADIVAADFFKAHIADEAFCILVAEAEKRKVGYCLCEVRQCEPRLLDIDRYGHISNLVVTEDYRRRGIGKALVSEAARWFSEKGVHNIEVAVASSNDTAKRFWSERGFKRYEDVLLLET